MSRRRNAWHRAKPCIIPLLSSGMLALAPCGVAAQDIGDAVAGHQLAATWCASCHAIDPAPQTGDDNGAPAFSAVAAMPSTTPMALAAFLRTPHSRMPDLQLSRNEVADLSAYILSLRQK